MRENPFLDYIHSHPRADAGALKELYRILAKRTHPDTSAESDEVFAELQDAYHEALALLVERSAESRGVAGDREDAPGTRPGQSARTLTLQGLYRYLACVPRREIDTKPIHPRCRSIFALALKASSAYHEQARAALEAYAEQFHEKRATTARYPDVRTKYACLIDGLHAFFEYQLFEAPLSLRVARSYLSEVQPVRDYDPAGDPNLRTNRSAAARAALFAMKLWIESEMEKPPARLL